MVRFSIAYILFFYIHIAQCRFIEGGQEVRSDRVVSVYDRNCFFSPMFCHFLNGRKVLTFITPEEVKEIQAAKQIRRGIRHTEEAMRPAFFINLKRE